MTAGGVEATAAGVDVTTGSTDTNARAVSTVLDASLCLLLVSASALTLAGTPAPGDSDVRADTADRAAEMLATSTARVSYAVGDDRRTAHDTLAGLLAVAAAADARAESSALGGFEEAVVAAVDRALRDPGRGTQVVARWRTEDDGPHGRVVAGDAPPPDADVHAAAFDVGRVRITVRTWSR